LSQNWEESERKGHGFPSGVSGIEIMSQEVKKNDFPLCRRQELQRLTVELDQS
jgi:hypothetical protein